MKHTINILLQALTRIPAPSGSEDELRDAVLKMIRPHADEIRVDALGNLIARKGKLGRNGRRIMLAAHLDEIGVIVSHVDNAGYCRFSTLGGFSPHRLVGTRLKFLNGAAGVLCLERVPGQKERAPGISSYFIDTGATSPEDCPVHIGDMAVLDSGFSDLGGRVVSRCLDDRVGVVLLIESLRNQGAGVNEITYVFTVQEEVGGRGAGPAAYGLEPEIGLAVDVAIATDLPNDHEHSFVALGGGPAIKVKDAGVIADPGLVNSLKRIAEKKRIPVQLELTERIGTDARPIQMTGRGARAGGIGIPLRHLHSPSEMIDMRDVELAGRLLSAFIHTTEKNNDS
jgi:endoglucanase